MISSYSTLVLPFLLPSAFAQLNDLAVAAVSDVSLQTC